MPSSPSIQGSSSSVRLKACLLLLALALAVYIVAPPLYWRFQEGIAALRRDSTFSCPPCTCECAPVSSSVLSPGGEKLAAGCNKVDKSLHEQLDKYSVDLLSEELKLQASVAEENQHKADSAVLDAKKLSSQYQKEAEKCSFGMETCEQAREEAEAALATQKKVTDLWEKRARDLGWKSE